jgi:hypothetical protein
MVHIFSFLIPHVIYNLLSHVIQKQCLLGVLNQVTPTIANFTNPGYPQRWTVLLCSWGAVTTILSSYQTSGCRRFHQVIRVLLLFWRLCSLKIFSLSSSYGTTIILRRTVVTQSTVVPSIAGTTRSSRHVYHVGKFKRKSEPISALRPEIFLHCLKVSLCVLYTSAPQNPWGSYLLTLHCDPLRSYFCRELMLYNH